MLGFVLCHGPLPIACELFFYAKMTMLIVDVNC